MDSGGSLRDRSEEVRHTRRRRGEPRGMVDQPEGVRVSRTQPALVVMREELGLQRRHVDADRTVLRTALAGEAEVERRQSLVGAPELELLAVLHLPKQPRAPARRVLFLARDHVARTHHAALRVPAVADADAAKRRVLEAAVVLLIREVGLQLRRRVVGAETEVVRDPVRVDDLAGIHLPAGIPDRLDLAERLDQLGPEHLRQQLCARLAVAVLARQRAAELQHDVRCFIEEGAVLPEARLAREIEVPTCVDTALAVVPVERAVVLVLLGELPQPAQVFTQPLRWDRGVLPALVRVRLAGNEGGCAESGLADLPDVLLLFLVVDELDALG